jgi:hypothetical protein
VTSGLQWRAFPSPAPYPFYFLAIAIQKGDEVPNQKKICELEVALRRLTWTSHWLAGLGQSAR